MDAKYEDEEKALERGLNEAYEIIEDAMGRLETHAKECVFEQIPFKRRYVKLKEAMQSMLDAIDDELF